MRRGRVWFTPIAAIVVLALTRAHAARTIKLGVAGPLTGDQGAFGQELKNGVIIAVEEWNTKGGVLGKQLEIVWGDDQHDPKQAVAVANALKYRDVDEMLELAKSLFVYKTRNINHEGKVVQ